MSGNRAPATMWALRKDFGATGYVHTTPEDLIALVVPAANCGGELTAVRVTRKDARLIARRINECLDATVKR